ncbi:MAG: hypothetical protein HQL56_14405 [Magnetococcales bacterium]|nr:hypothetical protein [Magnetococcales bacterium]MBF0426626.1 hypothetical protein [Magnetococcales bacterium]
MKDNTISLRNSAFFLTSFQEVRSWWIGIRRVDRGGQKVIVPLRFASEEEAVSGFALVKAMVDADLCRPVQANSEREALERMRNLMGW